MVPPKKEESWLFSELQKKGEWKTIPTETSRLAWETGLQEAGGDLFSLCRGEPQTNLVLGIPFCVALRTRIGCPGTEARQSEALVVSLYFSRHCEEDLSKRFTL